MRPDEGPAEPHGSPGRRTSKAVSVTPEQIRELLDSAGLTPDSFVTGAMLIVRTKDMDSGDTSIHIGRSDDTDWITEVGMLAASNDILRQVAWHRE